MDQKQAGALIEDVLAGRKTCTPLRLRRNPDGSGRDCIPRALWASQECYHVRLTLVPQVSPIGLCA